MVGRFYYVYIMASRSRVLYIGMTNQIVRRAWEHRQGAVAGFAKQYKANRLVYFEQFQDVKQAISREKEIKSWRRERKVRLIEAVNPTWEDLAVQWWEKAQQEAAAAARKRAALKEPGTCTGRLT